MLVSFSSFKIYSSGELVIPASYLGSILKCSRLLILSSWLCKPKAGIGNLLRLRRLLFLAYLFQGTPPFFSYEEKRFFLKSEFNICTSVILSVQLDGRGGLDRGWKKCANRLFCAFGCCLVQGLILQI